jgi:hypothetical protein
LVVLVLVVLWVAVLAPRAVRRVREGRSQASIESFHEQLHLLERAGPKLVEPAYRLGTPIVPLRPQSEPPTVADVTMGGHGGLMLLDRVETEQPQRRQSSGPRTPAPRTPAHLRQRGRRRRRDILLGLIATAAVTGSAGFMHQLHVLWVLTAISVVCIAGYVALAAYVQMIDADRQALQPIATPAPDRPPSPWALNRPRHAPGEPLPGVEVLTPSVSWAAKAGYPGAWDDDAIVARHAAGGS